VAARYGVLRDRRRSGAARIFFNVARYIADPGPRNSRWVGGGEHDWNTILRSWNLLDSDRMIAAGVSAAGWAGIVAIWAVTPIAPGLRPEGRRPRWRWQPAEPVSENRVLE